MNDYGMIQRRVWDGSYVITKNGMPYHVPKEGQWAKEWKEVDAYAREHPDEVEETASAAMTFSEAAYAAQIMEERNRRLAESDWTQVPDALEKGRISPEARRQWADYRAKVYEIKRMPGFPWKGMTEPDLVPWPPVPARD